MSAPEDVLDAEYVTAPLAVVDEAPLAMSGLLPTVTPQEARAAWLAYAEVCEAVLTKDDYQEFTERGQTRRFKKKSAVKKLQTFWGISVIVRDVVRDDLGEGHFGFRCTATATSPSGRAVEATGGCSTHEDRFEGKDTDPDWKRKKARARSYHDVMSTAETRATNRAVMNCIGVGGGEVTADEISRTTPRARPPAPAPAQRPAAGAQAPRATAKRILMHAVRKAVVAAQTATDDAMREMMTREFGAASSNALADVECYDFAAMLAEAYLPSEERTRIFAEYEARIAAAVADERPEPEEPVE